MAWSRVQSNLAIHGSSVPGSVTIGATPTVGNLLIAFIGCNIGAGSITIGTGWTIFDRVVSATGNVVMVALYRYVQVGDTTTLPAFWSAGATYWTHDVVEITSPSITGSWNSDFLCSIPLPDAQSNAALPQFPIFADGIALSGTASYNGSTNPTISGSWTRDDAANNNGNYGSAAGAHRVVSNGNTIDGQWTQGSSSPYGAIIAIFTSTQPTGGVYPRHIWTALPGNVVPGSFTMPWTPKVGSLLIAYVDMDDGGGSADMTVGVGWTDWLDTVTTHKMTFMLYRYVQIGDTATLPAFGTANGGFCALTVIELDGGSGTFGTDHASDKSHGHFGGGASSETTTADTTTANNQFALLHFAAYDINGPSTTTGFTNYLSQFNNFGAYGTGFNAFAFFPSSGSTVQGTISYGQTSGDGISYIQSIFNQGIGSSTETATGTLTFVGLSFSGHALDYERGVGGLAFSGINFLAAGSRHGFASGLLSFGGISFLSAGHDYEFSSGRLTFSGVSFLSAGHDYEFSSGVLALSGIGFNASALDYERATGLLGLSGISFNVSALDYERASGLLAFGGISFLSVGHDYEFGSGELDFFGVSFNGAGLDVPPARARLHFSGISFLVSCLNAGTPGGGLRQFWTFE